VRKDDTPAGSGHNHIDALLRSSVQERAARESQGKSAGKRTAALSQKEHLILSLKGDYSMKESESLQRGVESLYLESQNKESEAE